MSPRRQNPDSRATLIDAAARLVAEGGPSSLSARMLAKEAGTSTMAVYTYFGSMSAIVREIVHDGFARLQRLFDLVEPTDDPVADLALLGRVYRHNAITNRHVFEVMFGGSTLAGFALTEEDRQHGRYTLTTVVEAAYRCVDEGRFRPDDPVLKAHNMWLAVHGTVLLDLGGYLVAPYDANRCFESQLVSLMIAAGDDPDRAVASVAESAIRFEAQFGQAT
ncbi:MAG TPA: TetR/AcrR family transcriptional regulator [Streptosporangiaceae bacterium]|nr:TetR/AcrR family transcriptional regulator [Streptosporangiaceae bacterium]